MKKTASFTKNLIISIAMNVMEGAALVAKGEISSLVAFVCFGTWKGSKVETEHKEFNNHLKDKINNLSNQLGLKKLCLKTLN